MVAQTQATSAVPADSKILREDSQQINDATTETFSEIKCEGTRTFCLVFGVCNCYSLTGIQN